MYQYYDSCMNRAAHEAGVVRQIADIDMQTLLAAFKCLVFDAAAVKTLGVFNLSACHLRMLSARELPAEARDTGVFYFRKFQ